MIFLRAYAVMFAPSGRKRLVPLKRRERISWPNEFYEFNIFEPKAWKKYLAEEYRLPNKRKLPNFTNDGDPIVYEIYMWGTSQIAQEYFNMKSGPGGAGGKIYLFPGYHKEGPRGGMHCTLWETAGLRALQTMGGRQAKHPKKTYKKEE